MADRYPTEPKANGPGFVSPLQGCPNTLLTPHIGGSTEEAQAAIGIEVQAQALAIGVQAHRLCSRCRCSQGHFCMLLFVRHRRCVMPSGGQSICATNVQSCLAKGFANERNTVPWGVVWCAVLWCGVLTAFDVLCR
jgi:hypothetical protein